MKNEKIAPIALVVAIIVLISALIIQIPLLQKNLRKNGFQLTMGVNIENGLEITITW